MFLFRLQSQYRSGTLLSMYDMDDSVSSNQVINIPAYNYQSDPNFYQVSSSEGVNSQQTRGIHPMLFKCWATVFDAGPTLKQHRLNASCLLGIVIY